MNCVVCDVHLENLLETMNQPMGGTMFVTLGHYGSSITDCMDDTRHVVNVCDKCLRKAIDRGTCLVLKPR